MRASVSNSPSTGSRLAAAPHARVLEIIAMRRNLAGMRSFSQLNESHASARMAKATSAAAERLCSYASWYRHGVPSLTAIRVMTGGRLCSVSDEMPAARMSQDASRPTKKRVCATRSGVPSCVDPMRRRQWAVRSGVNMSTAAIQSSKKSPRSSLARFSYVAVDRCDVRWPSRAKSESTACTQLASDDQCESE